MLGAILSFLSNLFGFAIGTVLSISGIAGLANSEAIQEAVMQLPYEMQAQGCKEYVTPVFSVTTAIGTAQSAGNMCSMYREATQKNEIKSKDDEIRNLKNNVNRLRSVAYQQSLHIQGLEETLNQVAANMADGKYDF